MYLIVLISRPARLVCALSMASTRRSSLHCAYVSRMFVLIGALSIPRRRHSFAINGFSRMFLTGHLPEWERAGHARRVGIGAMASPATPDFAQDMVYNRTETAARHASHWRSSRLHRLAPARPAVDGRWISPRGPPRRERISEPTTAGLSPPARQPSSRPRPRSGRSSGRPQFTIY